MAATLVHQVDSSARQSLSWSSDDRLAISADKEIIIMKLNVSASSKCKFHPSTKSRLSVSNLVVRELMAWTGLEQTLLKAHREARSSFLKRWTYSSLSVEDQVSTSWSRLSWSPVGVLDNRSVLAALTRDHRIHIIYPVPRAGFILADLGNQLNRHVHDDFESTLKNLHKNTHEERLSVILEQMLSIAAVELVWSSVFEGPQSEEKSKVAFILLCVGMRNGDIVTWKINLPFMGIDSCSVIDRRSGQTHSTVISLAWTDLSDDKNSGLLAVGYADGQMEIHRYQYDPSASPDTCLHTCSYVLQDHVDWMPVSALAWTKNAQVGLVLLCTKEQTTSVYTISHDHHGNPPVDEESREGRSCQSERKMQVIGSYHASLGNWLPASGVHCVGETVVVACEDGNIFVLSLSGSQQNPKMSFRKLQFEFEECGWGCISVCLSHNAVLCATLFRPNFSFNHLADRFRSPVQVHICMVPTPNWTSLEEMLLSGKEANLQTGYTDVLEFARHILCMETNSATQVASLTQKFMTSPYTDTVFGNMVARHLLSTLHFLCMENDWSTQMKEVEDAKRSVTDALLCHQIRCVLDTIRSYNILTVAEADLQVFNSMLNWIKWSSKRIEAVGSEAMYYLTLVVPDSEPDTCALCDSNLDYSESTLVICNENHAFGLCCHTLSLCTSVPNQCCSTCDALALSPKHLRVFKWLKGSPSVCTLCGSFMYNTNTSLRV